MGSDAWITGWFTLAAAAIAFGPVAYQIWSQGRQNRLERKVSRKQAFNEELYRDGVAAARRLASTSTSLTTAFALVQSQVALAITFEKEVGGVRPPEAMYPELLALNSDLQDSVFDLVLLLEERLIAEPGLEVFRKAFLANAYDIRNCFDREFQWSLVTSLPHRLPTGELSKYQVPTDESQAKLESKIAEIIETLADCTAFANDLILELQNVHLGDTFGRREDYRVPLDDRKIVLRLDRQEQIQIWVDDSPWGKECDAIEAETRKRLGIDEQNLASNHH